MREKDGKAGRIEEGRKEGKKEERVEVNGGDMNDKKAVG